MDTTPSNGNRSAVDFLANLAKEFGFAVDVQSESLNGLEQANIIARTGSKPVPGEFMLQTHLDTVDPGTYSLWTKTEANPFNASIYDRELFGLGAADTKLDFLCKLFAAKEFVGRDLKRPVVVVGTYGAQSGMAGAVRLVRKKKVMASYALIGEPTNLKIMSSGKGMAVVQVKIPFTDEEREYRSRHDTEESSSSQSKMFSGRAAHSMAPHLGDSAIVKMFSFLQQLPAGIAVMELDGGINYNSVPSSAYLEFDLVGGLRSTVAEKISAIWRVVLDLEKEFRNFKEDGFIYPFPSLNIGQIRTLEEGIEATGSCRIPPTVKEDVYEGWMSRLDKVCRDVGAEFKILDYKPSFESSPGLDFVISCQSVLNDLTGEARLGKLAASTEASVFNRLGIECLVFGPGQSVGNSHEPNESVNVDELETAKNFYGRVIEKVCL
ncbi:MAG: M20/M25/M40 family metallo-hydrolase [Bdellovibrionales bacterium]|nr:M20/M25/M40 family metallo-hydrolase [Bdellovibrionales bacterium]